MTISTSYSFKILIASTDTTFRAYVAQPLTYGWKSFCLHSLRGSILLVKVKFIF